MLEFKFNKTGYIAKSTNSKGLSSAITNHIRSNYTSTQDAYIDQYNIKEIPSCKYCGKSCKFKSFSKGFYDFCGSSNCLIKTHKSLSKSLKLRDVNKINTLIKDINNLGIDKFLELCKDITLKEFSIFNNITPHFENKNINTLISRTARFLGKEKCNEIFNIIKKCNVCNESYNFNRLKSIFLDYNKSNTCGNKRCVGKTKNYTRGICTKICNKPVFLKTKKLVGTYKGIDIAVNAKSKKQDILSLCSLNNFELIDVIKHLDPDVITTCKICNKEYIYKKSLKLGKYCSGTSKHVCSKNCYYKFLAKKDLITKYTKINSKEVKRKLSQIIKQKILEGKFKPCVTNSYCKSKINYIDHNKKLLKFRSSWEFAFYCFMSKNSNIEYENTRIKYYDTIKNKKRIYIIDFTDNINKIIYEIKPDSCKNANFKDKQLAAKQYCLDNNYKQIIIDDEFFKQNINSIIESIPKEYIVKYNILKKMNQFMDKSK